MVAGTVLGIQILYMLFSPALRCNTTIIYPLLNLDSVAFIVSCCITPILFFIVFAAFLRDTNWRDRSGHSYLNTRFLAIVLMVSSFLFAYVNVVPLAESSYSQIDAEHLNDEIYVLVLRVYSDFDVVLYDTLLYRCDRIGIYCQLVHIEPGNPDALRLSSDPATNTISILVDDEIVFTYPEDYVPVQDDYYCP